MVDSVADTDLLPLLGPGGLRMVSAPAVLAAIQVDDIRAALAALTLRVAVLEARPEEVAHFTGTAKFPTLVAAAAFTLTISSIVPTRVGDALKSSEQVEIYPLGAIPSGVSMGRPSVNADGSVAVPCQASLAIASGQGLVAFALVALR